MCIRHLRELYALDRHESLGLPEDESAGFIGLIAWTVGVRLTVSWGVSKSCRLVASGI
jgi:hypothetical protein